jgi:hypothetical protein
VRDEPLDVTRLRIGAVVTARRPLAIAVAALVERDAAMLVAQRQAHEVPGVSGQAAAVEEEHGRPIAAPVEVVQADTA